MNSQRKQGENTMSFVEQQDHCENGCIYNRGWFRKIELEIHKLEPKSYAFTPIPKDAFIRCACASERSPFFIYTSTVRMLRILGCKTFEATTEHTDSTERADLQVHDVKESDTWKRINQKPSGQSPERVSRQVSRQNDQIDGIRDLSVTNVDRLPESVHEMFHPIKKRVSDISIFKAEEFNAGDPFAQMKSDEVDDFYGSDDAP